MNIEVIVCGKDGLRFKEVVTQNAHLSFNLAFLPSGTGRTSHRFKSIVAHQGAKKRGIKRAIFPFPDIRHHRLGIINNDPAWHTTIKAKSLIKGVQNHLLAFAQVGHHKRFTAVTQTKVRHINLAFNSPKERPSHGSNQICSASPASNSGECNQPPEQDIGYGHIVVPYRKTREPLTDKGFIQTLNAALIFGGEMAIRFIELAKRIS